MRAVRRSIAGYKRTHLGRRKPFREAAFQHALSRATDAGDDNHGPVAPELRRSQELQERGAAAVLGMAVQVEARAYF